MTHRVWSAPETHLRHSWLQGHSVLGVDALPEPQKHPDMGKHVDSFLFMYWLAAAGFCLFIAYFVQPWIFSEEPEQEEEEEQPRMVGRTVTEVFREMDGNADGRISAEEFAKSAHVIEGQGGSSAAAPAAGSSDVMTAQDRRSSGNIGPKEVELPQTMWSLNIVAAIGQAQVRDKEISATFVGSLTLFMAFLQIFALFLVVHDINPDVHPVTVEPSSPWIKSGWSVNCMKWLMVTFMSILMITEAGECRTILTCILETNSHRLREPRWLLMSVCFFQYIIMILVIWGGVAAVLSFQSVPDILYSSMSITYIAKVDEAFFTMLYQIFEIEADFTVVHGRKVAKMTSEGLFAALDADGDGQITRGEFEEFRDEQMRQVLDEKLRPEKLSHETELFLHFLSAFPCLLGFFLIGRAMYTNVMPTDRFHALKDDVLWLVKQFMRAS